MKNPNRTAAQRRRADGKETGPDTLIIVNSRHGSALRYANWIEKALNADIMSFDKQRLGYAALYDNLIYIGWVRNGSIEGLNLLQQNHHNFGLYGKKIIVAAVGASEPGKDYLRYLKKFNYLTGDFGKSFYFLPGAVDPDKLNAADRSVILNNMPNGILKDLSKGTGELLMERLTEGYNGIDMGAIQPIVDEILTMRGGDRTEVED